MYIVSLLEFYASWYANYTSFMHYAWHPFVNTYGSIAPYHHPQNNLTGVAVQFATQDQINATKVQKYIAIFNIKICYYHDYVGTFHTNYFKAGIFCYTKFWK